jgi:hypothetical protein
VAVFKVAQANATPFELARIPDGCSRGGERKQHEGVIRKGRASIRLEQRVSPTREFGFKRKDPAAGRQGYDVRAPASVLEFASNPQRAPCGSGTG